MGALRVNGQPYGAAVLGFGLAALVYKMRLAGRLMSRHFPEAYPDYRRRVTALVPFVA